MTDSKSTSELSYPLTSPLAAWGFFGDLGRQQLHAAVEGASAMFRGLDALRAIQQETAHQAAAQYVAAARILCAPYQPAELMVVESELLQTDVEEAGNYFQRMATSALESQVEMMAQASRLLDHGVTGAGGATTERAPPRVAASSGGRRRSRARKS